MGTNPTNCCWCSETHRSIAQADGSTRWARDYGNGGNGITAIGSDTLGNAYFAGGHFVNGSNTQVKVYDTDGGFVLGAIGAQNADFAALAVEPDGSAFYVGYGPIGGIGNHLTKFASDGTILWQQAYPSFVLALRDFGVVYCNAGAGVARLDPDTGAVVWSQTWNGANFVADSVGVYVAANASVGSGRQSVKKYDQFGALLWESAPFAVGETPYLLGATIFGLVGVLPNRLPLGEVFKLDLASGALIASSGLGYQLQNRGAADDESIYLHNASFNFLHRHDPSDFSQIWETSYSNSGWTHIGIDWDGNALWGGSRTHR